MDFYYINDEYITYLQQYETERRGYTKVPNVIYKNRNKFSFGAVLDVNGIKYYVAVSSYTKSYWANCLIKIPGDLVEVKGSLRFNYMFPVPEEMLQKMNINDITDQRYRDLVYKEHQFCLDNFERIKNKARNVYEILLNTAENLATGNCCDFKILEEAYRKYLNRHSIRTYIFNETKEDYWEICEALKSIYLNELIDFRDLCYELGIDYDNL